MGYHIAKADQNGNRIVASERQLTPGPTRVDYPTEPAGALIDTADGRVIQQQPLKDGRKRAWIWEGYPGWQVNYQDLWNALVSLRSRYRKQLYGAATPYIYIKEDVTGELTRLVTVAGTATSGAASTLTDTGQAWTVNAYTGYEIEIIQGTGAGQLRTVASNTATVITVTQAWTTNPDSTSKYAIRGQIADWFRCRVVDVTRTVKPGQLLTFEETRMVFVIDDPAFNDLG